LKASSKYFVAIEWVNLRGLIKIGGLKMIRESTELCWVWHSHSSDSEECGLLGLNTVKL
jgi:hypothetical protein